MRAVPFEGELLMLLSFDRELPMLFSFVAARQIQFMGYTLT
jgi:hypothetical protein